MLRKIRICLQIIMMTLVTLLLLGIGFRVHLLGGQNPVFARLVGPEPHPCDFTPFLAHLHFRENLLQRNLSFGHHARFLLVARWQSQEKPFQLRQGKQSAALWFPRRVRPCDNHRFCTCHDLV